MLLSSAGKLVIVGIGLVVFILLVLLKLLTYLIIELDHWLYSRRKTLRSRKNK